MSDARDSKPPVDPKRRSSGLLGFLRRGPLKQETQTFLDENALWHAHQLAEQATSDAARELAQLRSGLNRGRSSLDEVADRTRVLARREQDLMQIARRLLDGYERLALLSLNTGLEANRIGDRAGRALGLVSDDLRSHADAGRELSRELSTSFEEIHHELEGIASLVDQGRELGRELAGQIERAETASSEGQRALGDVRERLKKATGSDPETMRAIAEVTEHARALVSGLGTLTGRVPERLVIAAVRPVLEPLLRLLASDDESA